MKKQSNKLMIANLLTQSAKSMIVYAANSRCAFVYHQAEQPIELKKFRKF